MSEDVEIIAEVDDLNAARVLIAALRAHGFHPLDTGDGGFPGILPPTGGIPILVPGGEALNARILAEELLEKFDK